MQTILHDAANTQAFAHTLAQQLHAPCVIYLEGPLGAGKTTFAQGFLRGAGYHGVVKSPTYTIVETYQINNVTIVHADLYRISDVQELENIGFRDYFNNHTIALIEWASRVKTGLPQPNRVYTLALSNDDRRRVISDQ